LHNSSDLKKKLGGIFWNKILIVICLTRKRKERVIVDPDVSTAATKKRLIGEARLREEAAEKEREQQQQRFS
jgi:hypothetical protein